MSATDKSLNLAATFARVDFESGELDDEVISLLPESSDPWYQEYDSAYYGEWLLCVSESLTDGCSAQRGTVEQRAADELTREAQEMGMYGTLELGLNGMRLEPQCGGEDSQFAEETVSKTETVKPGMYTEHDGDDEIHGLSG